MRLILIQPHTHAGRDRLPGEVIDVDHVLADWLIERGVGLRARRLRRVRSTVIPEPLASAETDSVVIQHPLQHPLPPTESSDP